MEMILNYWAANDTVTDFMLNHSARGCNDNGVTFATLAPYRGGAPSMNGRMQRRRDTLNLRIPTEVRNLIDYAAIATGKTLTDFILGAARRAAEDALLERTVFSVSPEAYAEFLARLDAQAQARVKQTGI